MAKQIKFDKTEYDAYRAKGLSNTQIASKLGMSDATLYGKLKQWRGEEHQDVSQSATKATPEQISQMKQINDEYARLYDNRIDANSMLKFGMTKYDVARKYNVSVAAVDMFISKRKKFTPEQMHDMRTRLRNGDSIDAVAAHYDTTPQILSAIFKTNICPTQTTTECDTPVSRLVALAATLSSIYNDLLGAQEYYDECSARVDTLNKCIQDVLHKIEFGEYNDNETAPIVQSLAEYRKERRELKNYISLFEPLRVILSDAHITVLLHDLSTTCDALQKRAKEMSTRVYKLKGGDDN